MTSPEDKEKRKRRRERNIYAKELERRRYRQRVIPNKKREKISIRQIDKLLEEDIG